MASGFEDLIVWQRARVLCLEILPVVREAAARRDYALSQQLNASALSIMANIAEGHLRGNRRQFAYFLRIAAGSNGETRACLYAAIDRNHISTADCASLIATTNEIGKLLQGLIRSLTEKD